MHSADLFSRRTFLAATSALAMTGFRVDPARVFLE
jgi:hypothetical protein